MDTATVTKKLLDAEVPCGPINSIDQAFNDPQVQHLGLVQKVAGSNGKDISLPRQPFRLSRTPSKLTRSHARIRRAHRRSAGRVRLRRLGDQGASRTRRRGVAAQPQLSAHPARARPVGCEQASLETGTLGNFLGAHHQWRRERHGREIGLQLATCQRFNVEIYLVCLRDELIVLEHQIERSA